MQAPPESADATPGEAPVPSTRILALDRNRRNLELLSQFLGQAGYIVIAASNAEEFEAVLHDPDPVGLALIDLSGFDRGVWDLCEAVRGENIPFLVISPKQSAAIEQETYVHGAHSLLIKPLVVKQLLLLIRRLLEE